MTRTWIAALTAWGILLSGAGCGGGSSSGGGGASSTSAPVSSTAPVGGSAPAASVSLAVVATAPAAGDSNAMVDAPLFITFSADLDPGSISVPGAFELRTDVGPVTGSLSLVTPRVVELRPSANLTSAKAHLLRITPRVRDAQGNALPQDVLVPFTTSNGPVPIVGIAGHPAAPAPALSGSYRAGAAEVDMTPPVGVPLAGYGGGGRRRFPPDLNPFDFHTLLNPSTGVHDPVYAKAVVLDNGHERVAIVTLDAVATDAAVVAGAWQKASAAGFSVPLEKVLVCSSHTHSGPGAVSRSLLWQVLATDLYVDRVYRQITDDIAQAMVQAEQGLRTAHVGVGSLTMSNALDCVRNRRANDSPDLDTDDVDPEMIVVRIDDASGLPLATIWNFPIHGTHFGTNDLDFSADIMGSASAKAAAQGAGICLFMNGAEGDIKPTGGYDATGQRLADAILAARNQTLPAPAGVLQSAFDQVDMGAPAISLTLAQHAGAISHSGFVQGLAALGINPGVRFTFPSGWVDREFRYQAIRIGRSVIASMPGEPIHEIGLALKTDGLAMGFDHVMPAGLANGHGSYFTSEREYDHGGYEGMASFFGRDNGTRLVAHARDQMDKLRP